jgi:hypothetical protein
MCPGPEWLVSQLLFTRTIERIYVIEKANKIHVVIFLDRVDIDNFIVGIDKVGAIAHARDPKRHCAVSICGGVHAQELAQLIISRPKLH